MLWTRPKWMRPFIEEPIEPDDFSTKPGKSLLRTVALEIVFLGAGFVIQIISAAAVGRTESVIFSAIWAVAILLLLSWRRRTGSILRAVLLAGFAVAQVTLFLLTREHKHGDLSVVLETICICLTLLTLCIETNRPMRDPAWPHTGISEPFSEPDPTERTPEDNLTIFQWLTVRWVSPLINLGNKRQLNYEDVWCLGYEFQHRHLHDAFRELQGTVVGRLIYANWIDLLILTGLGWVELAADYSTPVILQFLLKAMEIITLDKRPAIKFALLMLVVRLVDAQVQQLALWFQRRCYERSRGEMITMLYEKTLNRKIVGQNEEASKRVQESKNSEHADADFSEESTHVADDESQGLLNGQVKKSGDGTWRRLFRRTASAFRELFTKSATVRSEQLQPASMGKILNLMRNDVYEVAQRFWEFQTIIFVPFGMVISLVLVWRLLGWSCLVGVAVVLVAQGVNAGLAKILVGWERRRRQATDTKLQKITQYVEAIRHLRWYGWHLSWLEGIMDARQKELDLRIITMSWNVTITFVNTFGSGILPVAAFYAYTALAGRELRVDIAFSALQLFTMLQKNLKEIPRLITVLLNAKVAVGRIEDFMKEPDKQENPPEDDTSEGRVELRGVSFSWPGTSSLVLRDISVHFPPGLSLVVGVVGGGKTALLQGLLGELDLDAGNLIKPTNAPIAYCSQTPWLQSMTIRENILFNSPYEDDRYKRVLDACALTPDLATFPHGDLSAIGENGIGLSGGQKARVALARAIYSRASILLLDDPISALDQQTAEWIVRRSFAGKLVEDRIVVLVTHRVDLCRGIAVQTIDVSRGSARVVQGELLAYTEPVLDQLRSHADQQDENKGQLMADAVRDTFEEEEHRAHGGVQAAVYWEYIKAGKPKWWLMVIVTATVCQALMVLESWVLKEWGEAYNRIKQMLFVSMQRLMSEIHVLEKQTPLSDFFSRFPSPADNVYPWLQGYFAIVSLEAVALLVSQVFMILVTYSAGKSMFAEIMRRISNSTFRYYDITPVGRLLNRLTSDVGTVDGNISIQFMFVVWSSVAWTSSIFVFASVTPTFLVFSLLLTGIFVYVFLAFLPTSQSLRRLEMVSLSPLMSNFGALLNGLMTVRAFCVQPAFLARVIQVVDRFQAMDHFYWSLQAWMQYRFDVLASMSTFALTLLAIFSNLTAGLTAFVLIAAQRFVQSTHALCKQYGQLQLDFVSVERVVELLHLSTEETGEIDPPASWPRYNAPIEFKNVTIKYTPTSPPAITDVSLKLPGGTHTAIVGRTGSGKSTLSLSLLATIPLELGSTIIVDGIDISKVNKTKLRQRVTFLAQDPVLFNGSLRHNLNPQSERSDVECLAALHAACLDTTKFTLDFPVAAHGANLSQGQRQLVSLARALLRRSSVVIMDEATASVDLETAERVYEVVRRELVDSVGCTVVSVAHRAGAMEGVDGVVRLKGGRLEGVEGRVEGMVGGEGED